MMVAKALSTLPVGAKIKDLNSKYYGVPIIWEVLDHNHSGYPASSTTVLAEKIITLKSFDAIEASNPDSNRKSYGNNRYAHSNIRKWLNTDANSWYSAQHSYDAPPTAANVWSNHNPYDGEKGFLANLTTEFKSKILTTTLKVAKNTVTDGGGSETLSDKVFLLSNTEVGLANENGISEGVAFSKFSSDSARLANPTSQAVANSTYTNSGLADGKPWYWWLRTPYASNSHYVRSVDSSGTLDNNIAYYGYWGVRPALNLQSGILVSDSPDSDGAYIIQWNEPPAVSGSDSDIGFKWSGFAVNYTVTDKENDGVTVVEKLNGTTLRSYAAILGQNNTLTIDDAKLSTLTKYQQHTLTITATDSKGASVTRTYKFTRSDGGLKVRLKQPMTTTAAARNIVVTTQQTMPNGSVVTIKACNNGHDANPTWEDITNAVAQNKAYEFTNKTKTAANWGVNVEIEINKGGNAGEIRLNAFGVSFN